MVEFTAAQKFKVIMFVVIQKSKKTTTLENVRPYGSNAAHVLCLKDIYTCSDLEGDLYI